MQTNPEKDWFGERRVAPEQKTKLVRGVFDSVADRYDLMNDLMSGGLHRLWKDRFVRMIRPRDKDVILDVAGGTGDIAFRLKTRAPGATITVSDINPHMLAVGRARAIDRGWLNDFEWVTGNAESLPFDDDTFDIYTIAFGLRNVTHIDTALREAARILKPGGRFYCLEFGHVPNPILSKIYDLYSSTIIPKMGEIITSDRESYQYLVESIRRFPPRKTLEHRMKSAGFANVRSVELTAGIVCVHQGVKA